MNIWTSFFLLTVAALCVVHAIFYGQIAKQEDYPFMVTLICKNVDGNDYNCCSGVIVSPSHVLTVGYCMDPKSPHFKYSRYLTGIRVGSNSGMGGGEIYILTEFMARNDKFDTVALIRVSKNFVWSDNVYFDYLVEVKAPEPKNDPSCIILGYGGPSDEVLYTVNDMVLRYSPVKFLAKSDCENQHLPDFRQDKMMCTNGGGNKGAYIQDRGAPLIWYDVIYGLVWTFTEHNTGYDRTGFIDLRQHRDWVDSHRKYGKYKDT